MSGQVGHEFAPYSVRVFLGAAERIEHREVGTGIGIHDSILQAQPVSQSPKKRFCYKQGSEGRLTVPGMNGGTLKCQWNMNASYKVDRKERLNVPD